MSTLLIEVRQIISLTLENWSVIRKLVSKHAQKKYIKVTHAVTMRIEVVSIITNHMKSRHKYVGDEQMITSVIYFH